MVSTRAGGKRSGDTVHEDERPAKQTKLEDHGVKEDSPEIQAIDPPEQQKAEEQPEEQQESESTATDRKEVNETPADTKAVETEDAKQANKDLEREEEVQEHGHVYFFYKPKVAVENPASIDDVARLHILLKPSEGPSRLIIVGRKYLPDPESSRQPIWAFVKQISDDPGELSSHLEKSSYETKTRGTRTVGEDRLVGAGPYAIIYHAGEKVSDRSSHLAYVLEAPAEVGEVQTSFNLAHEGSFGLSVRNPNTPAPPQAGLSTPATFPQDLQDAFESRRWNPVLDIRYLNEENSELLLVSHKKEVEGGSDVAEDLETLAAEDAEHLKDNPTKAIAQQVYEDLHIKKGKVDVEPISGSWD